MPAGATLSSVHAAPDSNAEFALGTGSPAPPPPADLAVAVTSTTRVVSPGATSGPRVTLTVTNNGPGTATDVSLGAHVGGGGLFTSPSAGCTLDATAAQLTCTATTLAAGASSAFSVTAIMPPAKPSGQGQVSKVPEGTPPPSISVSATVSSATADLNLSNNTATLAGGIAIGPSVSAAGKPTGPPRGRPTGGLLPRAASRQSIEPHRGPSAQPARRCRSAASPVARCDEPHPGGRGRPRGAGTDGLAAPGCQADPAGAAQAGN